MKDYFLKVKNGKMQLTPANKNTLALAKKQYFKDKPKVKIK